MFASIYQYIYLVIVIILTISVISQYDGMDYKKYINHSNASISTLIVITLFFTIAIGLRPLSWVFVDMMNYYQDYQLQYGAPFAFSLEYDNFIFDNILPLFASLRIPIEIFFLLISCIYFGCAAIACSKIFPRDALLAFVAFLGAFSTFSYGTNGIKAGAAASIFLLALASRKNKVLSIIFLFVSIGCHHSMLAPIVAYVMATYYRNPKLYLYAWIVCLLLAAAHITFFQSLFAGFTNEHGSEYLTTNRLDKNVTGFRPDFILYSAVPIFIGYYLMTKRRISSDYFSFLWCIYTATNCVFLLCTYGSYINRIAYLSWFMYPVVLFYPFINISWSRYQKKYLKQAVYYHLCFTLFMVFIYYGLFS